MGSAAEALSLSGQNQTPLRNAWWQTPLKIAKLLHAKGAALLDTFHRKLKKWSLKRWALDLEAEGFEPMAFVTLCLKGLDPFGSRLLAPPCLSVGTLEMCGLAPWALEAVGRVYP